MHGLAFALHACQDPTPTPWEHGIRAKKTCFLGQQASRKMPEIDYKPSDHTLCYQESGTHHRFSTSLCRFPTDRYTLSMFFPENFVAVVFYMHAVGLDKLSVGFRLVCQRCSLVSIHSL